MALRLCLLSLDPFHEAHPVILSQPPAELSGKSQTDHALLCARRPTAEGKSTLPCTRPGSPPGHPSSAPSPIACTGFPGPCPPSLPRMGCQARASCPPYPGPHLLGTPHLPLREASISLSRGNPQAQNRAPHCPSFLACSHSCIFNAPALLQTDPKIAPTEPDIPLQLCLSPCVPSQSTFSQEQATPVKVGPSLPSCQMV